jgi:hypothetical protein
MSWYYALASLANSDSRRTQASLFMIFLDGFLCRGDRILRAALRIVEIKNDSSYQAYI